MTRKGLYLVLCLMLFIVCACNPGRDSGLIDGDMESTDGDADTVEVEIDGDTENIDAEMDVAETDIEDSDLEQEIETEIEEPKYPLKIPFTIDRTDVGEPLTDAEITAFTKKITGFYKDSGYFNWVWWVSHGLDKSYDENMFDYKLWWQDTSSEKKDGEIIFSHYGGADNLTLRTCKVLNNVIAGYLMSGDEMFKRIVVGYLKGLVALSLGMEYGNESPVVKYLQARAIFSHDHKYVMEGDRKVSVLYDPVKHESISWNAHTIPNPDCVEFGDIWIRNMRSKDDVPHMFRSVPMIKRLIEESTDQEVIDAATLALEYLSGFAKDIVDQGYFIRTKDKDGNAVVPTNDDGTIKDLASFALFDEFLGKESECTSKLSSTLIAYDSPLENECGRSAINNYEKIATSTHYFNFAIIRYFHIAAIYNALMVKQYSVAEELMSGLIERSDRIMNYEEKRQEHHEWDAEYASFLLAAASTGMPLTSEEARLVVAQYTGSATHFSGFQYWDPWDDSVADGVFNYKPDRRGKLDPTDPESPDKTWVRTTELTFLLEYCYSPLRHENGAKFIDCDIVADPNRWGE